MSLTSDNSYTPRFPPIPPSDLTPDQKKAYDDATELLETYTSPGMFIYKDSSRCFVGNFAPLLYTPSLMVPHMGYAVGLSKLPGLPAKAREVAILVTGSFYDAPYVAYSHRSQAQTAGLSEKQYEMLIKGEKPDGLDEACEVAYEVALETPRVKGRVSDATWGKAERVLGKEGAAALSHYIGFYAYTSMFQNMSGVEAPE